MTYIQERNLTVREGWFQTRSNNAEGGYQGMQALIELRERPTAVFVADDIMAIGALKAAADSGLHVPNDISVVGFDDIDLARFVCPALTTMRQPIDAMSERVLNLILQLINEPQRQQEETLIRIPPVLVVRQSTTCTRLRQRVSMQSTPKLTVGCEKGYYTAAGHSAKDSSSAKTSPVGVDDALSVRVLPCARMRR